MRLSITAVPFIVMLTLCFLHNGQCKTVPVEHEFPTKVMCEQYVRDYAPIIVQLIASQLATEDKLFEGMAHFECKEKDARGELYS